MSKNNIVLKAFFAASLLLTLAYAADITVTLPSDETVAIDATVSLSWDITSHSGTDTFKATIWSNLGSMELPTITGLTTDPIFSATPYNSTKFYLEGTRDNIIAALTSVTYAPTYFTKDPGSDSEVTEQVDYIYLSATTNDGADQYYYDKIQVAIGSATLDYADCASMVYAGETCNGKGYCAQDSTCVCTTPYSGTYCEEVDCVNRCAFGTCQTDGTCTCDSTKYFGDLCDKVYCDDDGSNECNGQGDCDNDTGLCNCYDGYFGQECTLLTCYGDCGNNGGCDYTTGTCTCYPGYYGDDCSYRECAEDCGAIGYCDTSTGSCVCDSTDWIGNDCKFLACPGGGTCNGQGTCEATTGTCFCYDGYYGSDCSTTN